MDKLDTVLMQLASTPAPAGLDAIDDGVFASLAASPAYSVRRGVGAATVAAALVIGIAGATFPSRDAGATSLTPLASTSPLSPAALLGGEE
ncbi:hypothetical protein [Sphingomonas sp.]|uniref:hypothetical protein n=1 Tax=Sphingomonas sp. TaxID=28214 RepID=UPI00325F9A59